MNGYCIEAPYGEFMHPEAKFPPSLFVHRIALFQRIKLALSTSKWLGCRMDNEIGDLHKNKYYEEFTVGRKISPTEN